MHNECKSVSLGSLGVLRVHGAQALTFLQGQLSNDMTRLSSQHALLAGYHNPQGRVIALLRVLQLAPDEVLAILPRELVAAVAQRLGKFVLRSKAQLADDSAQWAITGLIESPAAGGAAALPTTLHGVTRIDASLAVCVAQQPPRWLLVTPAAAALPLGGCSALGAEVWQRLAIAAGEPQVYAATSEAFVAQMLNLDALGAIAFDKGCYTGQEIIARAHYRGKVKRRLQRFLTAAPARLDPGADGELADGRSFKVVDAAQREDGLCEFLAVTTLAGSPAERSGTAAAPGTAPLSAQRLELPYPLPD
jgi:tRNA-modifying protein YgfZ